jgi:hypothetical protein
MAESDADLTKYPMWIIQPEYQLARFRGDPRCNRSVVLNLGEVICLSGGHRPNQWGFAIIRTAYGPGSDEQFQHALTLIGRIAQVWADAEILTVMRKLVRVKENTFGLDHIPVKVDTRPNVDFVRRYQNDNLEDEQIDVPWWKWCEAIITAGLHLRGVL